MKFSKSFLLLAPLTMLFSCGKGEYVPKDPVDKEEYTYEEFKALVQDYYRQDEIKNKYKDRSVYFIHHFDNPITSQKEDAVIGGWVADFKTPEPAFEGDVPVYSVVYEWDDVPTGWFIVNEAPLLSPEYLDLLNGLATKETPSLQNIKYKTSRKHFVISYSYVYAPSTIIEETYNKYMMPYKEATFSKTAGNNIDIFLYQ